MWVRVLLWYRFAASFSSEFILKLSQLVLHFSDTCLSILPFHSQLSQPARKNRHKHTHTLPNDLNSNDYGTLVCLVNKLMEHNYCLFHWIVHKHVLKNKAGLSCSPCKHNHSKIHIQWYPATLGSPLHLCMRACVWECVYAFCVLTLIVFHLILSSSCPVSPGAAGSHPDSTPAQLSDWDRNC